MSNNLEGLWGSSTQEKMASEARGEFVVLPAGWYNATITGTELKETSSGGTMLVVDFDTKGTDIKDRLNIKNNSDKAQLIGRQKVAKIATCCNIDLKDSTQLHGLSIDIKLKVEEFKSNTSGEMLQSNKVTDYRKAGAGESQSPVATGQGAGW